MDISPFLDFLNQPFLGTAAWLWVLFLSFVGTILVLDLGVFNRKDHAVGFKESLRLAGVYITLGLLFGLWVWYKQGPASAFDYYTVYVIEESLSLDNLFVISVIFASFHIPREFQHRLLVWGIIGVIVLRGLMIGIGAAVVHHYSWVLFIFAAILLYTGYKMLFLKTDGEQENYADKKYVRFLAKHLRCTPQIHGNKFFVHTEVHGREGLSGWHATPLFLALIVVELTDVLFAFDSVPAALAITTDPYIVFTANIFAILGLRALFFAMEYVIHRLAYLKYALAVVLMFIGVKVFYGHLVGPIHPAVSLGITLSILAIGAIVSLMRTRGETQNH